MAKSNSGSKRTGLLIYVIVGKDQSLVNLRCQKLLDELIEPQQRATCLFKADPAKVSISEVLDELRTAPFLADKRVVVVKDADKFISKNRQLFEKYFDTPCPTSLLILTVSSWPAKTRLAKKLSEVGELISLVQPKAWQLPSVLAKYADETHDKPLSRTAAELLIELAGDNLPRLYSEIDKLALFADGDKSITPQHVESLVGRNRLFDCFAVINAVTAGDAGQAVARLRNMFAADRSAQYTATGAFGFHFRRMFRAKALLDEGARPAEVAGKLRIWGDRESFFAQLKKMTLKQIGDNIKHLAETDFQIKTGQAKPQVAIEQLVLKLTAGSNTH